MEISQNIHVWYIYLHLHIKISWMELNTPYMDPLRYYIYIYICTFDTSIYMYIYYVHVYLQYILHVPRADYPGHVRVWEEGASS